MTVNVEGFLKWNRDVNGFRPNIVTSWEWNDEATELTVNFRQGIKWSDGDPMTVDDYLFWWNDMVLDENVPVNAPFGTTVRGELMSVEKIDDYTLHFSFPHANPLFLEYKSRGAYHSSIHIVPEHYMRGFHPAYSDAEDATELVNRYNFGSRMHYPDRPTLSAWMTVDYVPSQRLVLGSESLLLEGRYRRQPVALYRSAGCRDSPGQRYRTGRAEGHRRRTGYASARCELAGCAARAGKPGSGQLPRHHVEPRRLRLALDHPHV